MKPIFLIFRRLAPGCFFLLLFGAAGCGPETAYPPDTNSGEFDVGYGTDDTKGGGDRDAYNEQDVENNDSGPDGGEFRKPEEFLQGQIFDSHWCDTSDRDHTISLGGRPHMKSTILAKEAWLYPGEFFVLDGCLRSKDTLWWLPSEYYIFALHEGTRLPIRVFESEDGLFPEMDVIESSAEETYAEIFHIQREPFTTFSYTFVIPPWAFDEEGAYNVQFVKLPAWEPYPSRPLIEKMTPVRGTNQSWHRTHTIYYGSEEFVETEPIRSKQDEATTWDVYEAGAFVNHLNWMFLAPPQEAYDWSEFELPWDGELGQVFEVGTTTVMLDFFYAGGELAWTDLTGEVLYYVFRDDEVIDKFLLEPPKFDLFMTNWHQNQGYVLPIEVELAEEVTAVTVMAVPWPFVPHVDGRTPMGNLPVASNTLLLRYAPD